MSMNDDDLSALIRLASAHARREDVAEQLRRKIADAARAPLARDIDAFLASTPKFDHAALLRKLADLNEGAIDDCWRAAFLSYLIAVLEVDHDELLNAVRAVRSYILFRDRAKTDIAARGAKGEVDASAADIGRLLGRRVS